MTLRNYIIRKFLKNLFVFGLLGISLVSFVSLFNKTDFLKSFSRIGNIFVRMYPMDTSIMSDIFLSLFETFNIAFFATIIGLITSLFILPFSNKKIVKIEFIPKLINTILAVFRTIPSMITAAILVALFGVGKFSGFISLYIIAILIITKILREYTDEINDKIIETAESQGLSFLQVYNLVVIKNIKSNIYSVFFLTLESNIRGASVLGLVGAGGIGQILWKELNHLRYDRVSIVILALILLITLIDFISYIFRTNLFTGKILNFSNYKKYKFFKKISIVTVLLITFIYAYGILNIDADRLEKGLGHIKNMFKSMLYIDFSYLDKTLLALGDSILVSLSSSFFAAITLVVSTYFSIAHLSNRITPIILKILYNIFRTIPAIIVAVIFFRGFGPGFESSFFALYFYTLGVSGKMYTEVLEGMDRNNFLSATSMGINSFITYIKIIFKGYLPEFISIILYRFEMNVKNSAILGMVGAGGIGQLIINNIEFRNWSRVSLLLLSLGITIICIENISYTVRNKIKK